MQAILHMPGTAPRPLISDEVALLSPHVAHGQLTIDFAASAPSLRELLGTAIPSEVLACGLNYLIVVPENAADYNFAPTPSAVTDFKRLTGVEPYDDEPLMGPILIIEA